MTFALQPISASRTFRDWHGNRVSFTDIFGRLGAAAVRHPKNDIGPNATKTQVHSSAIMYSISQIVPAKEVPRAGVCFAYKQYANFL